MKIREYVRGDEKFAASFSVYEQTIRVMSEPFESFVRLRIAGSETKLGTSFLPDKVFPCVATKKLRDVSHF